MNLKFLSRGERGTSNSAKKSAKPSAETGATSELGALKLNEDEIAEFEKWATEAKPNELMVRAAETHRLLRLKRVR